MKNRKFCTRNLACTIFFLLSPRSKLLDLWFIYWVLLVDLSTSFFYGNNIADVHKSSLHQRCCTLIIVTTKRSSPPEGAKGNLH
jgi:hypothetical protein